MRWLRTLLDRLPFGDATRRAFAETIADWRHETRTSRRGSRHRAALNALAGLLRIAASSFGSPREHPLRHVGQDLRYGWRRLVAAPVFAVFAVATLALAIGATTAVYALVHAATGPTPGVTTIDRVVNIYGRRDALSWPEFVEFRRHQTTLAVVAASSDFSDFSAALVADGHAQAAPIEIVSGDYFRVLGVAPALGRTLQPADERPEAPHVAVLSDALWERFFDRAPDVVGRILRIDGRAFEIVGVATPAFRGIKDNGLTPALAWVPLSAASDLAGPGRLMTLDPTMTDRSWLLVKGLPVAGVDVDRVGVEAEAIGRQLAAEAADGNADDGRRPPRPWSAVPMRSVPFENENDSSLIEGLGTSLVVAVLLVLLVASTNLANLSLARAASRQQEFVIRQALGASHWRQLREALVESAILASAGWLAGLAIARVIMVNVAGELTIVGTTATLVFAPRLDASVLVASVLGAFLAAGVFGGVPALVATRGGIRAVLAATGGQTTPRWRGRRFLVVGQVAVSLLLVGLSAAAVRQVRVEAHNDPGMDVDHIAVASAAFATQGYDSTRARQVFEAVADRLRSRPGVASVAITSGIQAVAPPESTARLSIPGSADERYATVVATTPGLFDTLGISLTHGQTWGAGDSSRASGVLVLSERTADAIFGRRDVVGRLIQVSIRDTPARELRVVGVAADTATRFYGAAPGALIYVPLDQALPEQRLVLAVRGGGDPSGLLPVIRQVFADVDPQLTLSTVDTGRSLASPTTLFFSIVAGITSLLGGFAWVVALAGLYGVLSQLVQRRTREIGVRMALGARRDQIVREVVVQGLRPAALGVTFGMALLVLTLTAVGSQFHFIDVSPDAATFLGVPTIFVFAAWLASYLPARRAASVDPVIALRDS